MWERNESPNLEVDSCLQVKGGIVGCSKWSKNGNSILSAYDVFTSGCYGALDVTFLFKISCENYVLLLVLEIRFSGDAVARIMYNFLIMDGCGF